MLCICPILGCKVKECRFEITMPNMYLYFVITFCVTQIIDNSQHHHHLIVQL